MEQYHKADLHLENVILFFIFLSFSVPSLLMINSSIPYIAWWKSIKFEVECWEHSLMC